MNRALERFHFTNPPAIWPTAETMHYDDVPLEALTPEQTIDALLVAGRSLQQPKELQRFLLELKHRQDRFNRMWTLAIGLGALALGMMIGATYL